jgi:hypothetical protein
MQMLRRYEEAVENAQEKAAELGMTLAMLCSPHANGPAKAYFSGLSGPEQALIREEVTRENR